MAMTKPLSEQVTYDGTTVKAELDAINAKLAEWVSVKDFGAVGDGVVDDTAAIQAACSSGHRAIKIPAGRTFKISTVNVQEGVLIFGEGASSKIEVIAGGLGFNYDQTPAFFGSTVEFDRLGFWLNNGSRAITFSPAISAVEIKVTNCNFQSAVTGSESAEAIVIYGAAQGLIAENTFVGQAVGYGTKMDCIKIVGDTAHNAINVAITENTMVSVRRGVQIFGDATVYNVTAGHRIQNNIMIGLSGYAVFASFTDYLQISHNMFDYIAGGVSGEGPDYAAIFADTVENLLVTDNWISPRYNSFGIYAKSTAGSLLSEMTGVNISGNRMLCMDYGGPKGTAINIESGGIQIALGTISNNWMFIFENGVQLIGSVTGFKVDGNTQETLGKSFSLLSGANGNSFENNAIRVVNPSDAFFGKSYADANYIGLNWINGAATYRRGKLVASGNGSQTSWSIPHGMPLPPVWANATAGDPAVADGQYIQYDGTNLIINYKTAPAAGSNNVVVNWELSLFV